MRMFFWTLMLAGFACGAQAQTIVLPPPVNYPSPTTGSVTVTKTIVAISGSKVTQVCNTTASGGGNIWLNPGGGAASSGSGPEAAAGGGCVTFTGSILNQNGNILTGISDSGTATYTVTTGN